MTSALEDPPPGAPVGIDELPAASALADVSAGLDDSAGLEAEGVVCDSELGTTKGVLPAGAALDCLPASTGQTVVATAITDVVTTVDSAGQFLTDAAQLVMVTCLVE